MLTKLVVDLTYLAQGRNPGGSTAIGVENCCHFVLIYIYSSLKLGEELATVESG